MAKSKLESKIKRLDARYNQIRAELCSLEKERAKTRQELKARTFPTEVTIFNQTIPIYQGPSCKVRRPSRRASLARSPIGAPSPSVDFDSFSFVFSTRLRP